MSRVFELMFAQHSLRSLLALQFQRFGCHRIGMTDDELVGALLNAWT